MTIGKALGSYWKLAAIDSFEMSSPNPHLPVEEYNKIVDSLMGDNSRISFLDTRIVTTLPWLETNSLQKSEFNLLNKNKFFVSGVTGLIAMNKEIKIGIAVMAVVILISGFIESQLSAAHQADCKP